MYEGLAPNFPLGFILWCIYQLAGWLSLLGFLEFKVLL
jgi:hypothetical protein